MSEGFSREELREILKEEFGDEIEKLKKENRELKRQNEQLKAEIRQMQDKTKLEEEDDSEDQQLSRRSFLKKLGVGAVGLGALSLAPAASKVTISDGGITQNGNNFWHSGMSNLAPTNIDWSSTDTTGLDADSVDGTEGSGLAKLNIGVEAPVYASTGDVPSSITKGEIVYIDGSGLYVEDGT